MKARAFLSAGILAISIAGFTADAAAAADRWDRHSGQSEGDRSGGRGDRGDRGDRGNDAGGGQIRSRDGQREIRSIDRGRPEVRQEARPGNAGPRNWGDARAQMAERKAERPQGNPGGTWNGGNRGTPGGTWNGGNRGTPGGSWNGGDNSSRGSGNATGNNNRERGNRWNNEHNGRENDNAWRHDNTWSRGDNDRRTESWNRNRGSDWRDNTWRSGRYNDRREWNRNEWRRDNRYDWRGYRDNHRSIYQIGRYRAPYHNHSYRRLGIGFFLGSVFYGNQYWISDPWYYRLPAVYGPYRWVRYYDDVLLVDVYTGEVVDVIYDFFW